MPSSNDYRRYSANCLAFAENVSKPEDKARLIEMAQAFLELATKREEKNLQGEEKNLQGNANTTDLLPKWPD